MELHTEMHLTAFYLYEWCSVPFSFPHSVFQLMCSWGFINLLCNLVYSFCLIVGALLPPVPALLHCVKCGVCVVCSVQAAYHILPDFSTAPFQHQIGGICVQHLCNIWWEEFPWVCKELWSQERCLPRVSWKQFLMWFIWMKST